MLATTLKIQATDTFKETRGKIQSSQFPACSNFNASCFKLHVGQSCYLVKSTMQLVPFGTRELPSSDSCYFSRTC